MTGGDHSTEMVPVWRANFTSSVRECMLSLHYPPCDEDVRASLLPADLNVSTTCN
jgi:hypothetical protein